MIRGILSSARVLIFSGYLVMAAVLFIGFSATNAQTQPQFIPFWQADSFVPADFTGKILPTEKSNIEVSFELLQNGKFVNLSGKRVVWLVNGNKAADGTNKKAMAFKNYSYGNSGVTIDVRVLDFKGPALSNTFTIPTAMPKLVIDSPYERRALAENSLNIGAAPFFWNVKNLGELVFSWTVDGVQPTGGESAPDKLSITIPEDTPTSTQISVEVSAHDSATGFQSAKNEIIYVTAR